MHVRAKRIAFLGLFTAISVLFVVLGSIIESSTLFFLALASYGVGIVNREYGKQSMVGFYIASVSLCFLIAPNKLYCITYAGMGCYLLLVELAWDVIDKLKGFSRKNLLLWGIKYVIFNILYIPTLLFFPSFVFGIPKPSIVLVLLAFIVGQAFLFLYDKAYYYTQTVVWHKLRRMMHLS